MCTWIPIGAVQDIVSRDAVLIIAVVVKGTEIAVFTGTGNGRMDTPLSFFAAICGAGVVVIALSSGGAASGLCRTKTAVRFIVHEVFKAHVEDTRISGLTIFVLVAAEWVWHVSVGTCVLTNITFVSGAPVVVVTVLIGDTASWRRFMYAVVGRVTAVDGAGIAIVAHAVRRTLLTGVL